MDRNNSEELLKQTSGVRWWGDNKTLIQTQTNQPSVKTFNILKPSKEQMLRTSDVENILMIFLVAMGIKSVKFDQPHYILQYVVCKRHSGKAVGSLKSIGVILWRP